MLRGNICYFSNQDILSFSTAIIFWLNNSIGRKIQLSLLRMILFLQINFLFWLTYFIFKETTSWYSNMSGGVKEDVRKEVIRAKGRGFRQVSSIEVRCMYLSKPRSHQHCKQETQITITKHKSVPVKEVGWEVTWDFDERKWHSWWGVELSISETLLRVFEITEPYSNVLFF